MSSVSLDVGGGARSFIVWFIVFFFYVVFHLIVLVCM